MSPALGTIMAVFYILFALVYFFPCLYLFRFGSQMQLALRNNDQQMLTSSFKYLKSWFRFVGILTIVVLSCWVLALVFGGLGAAMSGFR